jgi:hypothetical protein
MALNVLDHPLKPASYFDAEHPKRSIFIHHTAGAHNPVNVIDGWDVDTRGRVATAFVIGGRAANGSDNSFNGKVYRCLPEKKWAGHLGIPNNNNTLDQASIAIEICNFGFLRKAADGRFITYVNSIMDPGQVTKLNAPFRGYDIYQSYTHEQLESLRQLLIQLANNHNIDIRKGLKESIAREQLAMPPNLDIKGKQTWLRNNGFTGLDGDPISVDGDEGPSTKYALSCVGQSAFEINQSCLHLTPGLWTHTNVRTDKNDCFPQTDLKQLISAL